MEFVLFAGLLFRLDKVREREAFISLYDRQQVKTITIPTGIGVDSLLVAATAIFTSGISTLF